MYMINSIIPQADMITSRIQQFLGDLRVKHLCEGNTNMNEILSLRSYIRYIRPVVLTVMRIVSLSDASHGGAKQCTVRVESYVDS